MTKASVIARLFCLLFGWVGIAIRDYELGIMMD